MVKVADFLKQRRENWQELEQLCGQMETRRKKRLGPVMVDRFAALYRAACADLALRTRISCHRILFNTCIGWLGAHTTSFIGVGRLMSRRGRITCSYVVPQRIFADPCLHTAFCVFWGIFLLSMFLAWSDGWPQFARTMLTPEYLDQLESNFADEIGGSVNANAASFYIRHNTGIGLQCFAGGLLLIPGLLVTIFNAAHLGAAFGYMAQPEIASGENFFHFVTAHGPFELTAIVMSAAAGLRLGLSWIRTEGYRRGDSLRRASRDAMPMMGAAMVMFFMAALIEGFLSPSSAPYELKAAIACLSSGILMFYFVVLGYPRRADGPRFVPQQ